MFVGQVSSQDEIVKYLDWRCARALQRVALPRFIEQARLDPNGEAFAVLFD
jgi:hypothetical protein